jgi:hypothetical protein
MYRDTNVSGCLNIATSNDTGKVQKFMTSRSGYIAEFLVDVEKSIMTEDNLKNLSNSRTNSIIKQFISHLLSDLIYSEYITIVDKNDWNDIKTWCLPTLQMLESDIIDDICRPFKFGDELGTLQSIIKIVKLATLGRGFDLPDKSKKELDTILTNVLNTDEWITMSNELQLICNKSEMISIELHLIINRNEMLDCMFFTAWDLYFQITQGGTNYYIECDHANLRSLIEKLDRSNLHIRSVTEGIGRCRTEDIIIMFVNKYYSDFIVNVIGIVKLFMLDIKCNTVNHNECDAIYKRLASKYTSHIAV